MEESKMKKSYEILLSGGGKFHLSDGTIVSGDLGDIVYMLPSDAALFGSDSLSLTTDWQNVYSGTIAIGSGTVSKTLTISNITAGRKLLSIEVAVATASAASLPTGTIVTMAIKNAAGTTLETRTYTLGVIAAAGSESFNVLASAFEAGSSLVITIPFEQDGSGIVTIESALVTLSDVADDVSGASFTIGVSVAATNPIVTAIQLKDGDFADLTKRAIVKVLALADWDTLATLTTFELSTDGTLIGADTANKALTIMSEVDGDIDVTATKAAAGSIQIGVEVAGELIAISDKLVWTT